MRVYGSVVVVRSVILVLVLSASACSAPVDDLRPMLDRGEAEAVLAAGLDIANRGFMVRASHRAEAYRLAGDACIALDRLGMALTYYDRALGLDSSLDAEVLDAAGSWVSSAMRHGEDAARAVTLIDFLGRHRELVASEEEFLRRHEPAAYNLILFGVDTVRADHLGCYGYPVPTSPTIDALAAGGARFENAFSVSPWTCPSFLSAFTGVPPVAHGAFNYREPRHIPGDLRTLAHELHGAGLVTAAFTEGGYARPEWGMESGFDVFPADAGRPDGDDRVPAPLATNAGRTVDFIHEHRNSRFAVWLHTYISHKPLGPPAELVTALGPEWHEQTRGLIPPDRDLAEAAREQWRRRRGPKVALPSKMLHDHIRRYDAAILGIDRAVSEVLSAVADLELEDRTLVVFMADHGEGLMDHGLLEHGHNFHRELTRVPLILKGPGIAEAVIDEPVSLMGLANTLLWNLGLGEKRFDSPFSRAYSTVTGSVGGEPRFEGALLMQGLAVSGGERSAAAAVCWPYHLIAHDDGRRELYHLVDDPAQLTNLADTLDQELARCEALWREMEAEAAALGERLGAGADALAVGLDDRTRERLQALGYVEE